MKLTRLLLCASFCCSSILAHALDLPGTSTPAAAPVSKNTDAVVTVENREIVTFRSSVLGIEPLERAKRAESRVAAQLSTGGQHKASMIDLPPGILIQIDQTGSFYIAPTDIDQFQQESLQGVGQKTVDNLNLVIAETRESRSLNYMLKAFALASLATVIYLVLLWAIRRIRRVVEARILAFSNSKIDQLDLNSAQIVSRERVQWVLSRLVQTFSWLLVLLISYEWLSVVLEQFPLTRPWGEHLHGYFIGLIVMLGSAILKAIPDLFTAFVIFLLARAATQGLSRFFNRVKDGSIKLSWLDAEVAVPTRRIVNLAIWLFALAMAYPYLPGANTEAFKGVTVLVGLMVSMGASGLVGQLVSGLILTYTGIYRKGEFIHVLDYQGSIVEMGMFSTRIRNGMGVELTLPNSLVLSNVTQNYSKAVQGIGFIIDTKVTIGYDTPWRQVEQMLIMAALRTEGVINDPAPKVFQTALSDFYPEYLLICQAIPSDAQLRAQVMSRLHANIQDVFNEFGVQIMSPNYRGDPAKDKIVAKEDWYKAPAKLPD
ncbi:mechanosensitive ion channel family protein [Sapientia aquatica]|uniref:Small-conductance mechanosensitive channel n=1 Tax=Sapientia aquatica TaxID=1549640 RepID=A0A4R5W0X9_9BURK|nr:mechanosensitive ion channel domain-containing protein [Sapientia aquatica]TDK65592.1 mechanosensitive ion channel [Sapientia aquatica]